MTLEKILKKLDPDTVNEMNAMDDAAVKNTVAESEEAIAKATRERNALPEYQEAKANCSALSQGLKEVKARQNAKIAYGLRCLRRLAGEDLSEDEE